jgi:alkaline phosphatase
MKRRWIVTGLLLLCAAPRLGLAQPAEPSANAAPAVAAQPAPVTLASKDPAETAAADPTTFEGGRATAAAVHAQLGEIGRAKNLILFIGDGMGPGTVTAARIYQGQLRGEPGEENSLAFESFPHIALAKTYNTNQQTPDSAGTMTAIVTGSKTRAGMISVDRSIARGDFAAVAGNELPTLLERAEERGLSTGFVTTTTVTHATPATLYAHSPERSWESDDRLPEAARAAGFPDIARQLIEFPAGDGVEVALGGGQQHFLPSAGADPDSIDRGSRLDGRDLTAEWRAKREGATVVTSREQLLTLDTTRTGPVLGLFEPGQMHFEEDRLKSPTGDPSLSEMTATAIAILERNPRGYFLTVEGGRIDHAHHAGNARRALRDTIEFSEAVRVAREESDPSDTLILVTADHSHVFTIAGYPTRGNDILGKVRSNDAAGEPDDVYSLDAAGRPYTTLGYHNGPGARSTVLEDEGSSIHNTEGENAVRSPHRRRPDLTQVDTGALDFLQEAAVPLAYESHSAEDVAVYAEGPGAEMIRGVQEQNYLYHAMVEALGWNRRSLVEKTAR